MNQMNRRMSLTETEKFAKSQMEIEEARSSDENLQIFSVLYFPVKRFKFLKNINYPKYLLK